MITIRNCGRYNVESSLRKATNNGIVKRFLEDLSVDFAKKTSKYIDFVKEAPFYYRERQIHSILTPALYDLTDACLYELPTQRHWSKKKKQNRKDSHGWCDYWCSYKGLDFFIEVKHSYIRYNGTVSDEVKTPWAAAAEQLDVMKKNIREQMMYKTKGGVFLLLHIIVLLNKSTSEKIPVFEEERLLEIQQSITKKLKPHPNWTCLWALKDSQIAVCEEKINNGKSVNRYPGIVFAARVLHKKV